MEHRKNEAMETQACQDNSHAALEFTIPNPDCLQCRKYEEYKKSAEQSRSHYQADAQKDWPEDWSVRSVDMQKVIMLTRMRGVKTALFTRIVAYHETFAIMGKKSQRKKKTISVVWHEGTAGRKAEEITSSYVTALERERDVKHAGYWVDNCTSQNKNWCLLTSLVSVVNADSTLMEDITLKFLEPGHTFMSADSFHHGVEQEMKARPGGVVYDFGDFLHVAATSNAGKSTEEH
ncbi:uncharacterized protein LOC118942057 [Oncorhynchus mykiss]|uniref:uncharacterized protein LOC118942057 n=1 Tax=Oncorhynchus mykiss TaxID=8022 RepID=UPI001878AEE3|nr:uncharacterized protein LOC118942057 [Oncorhynchus mykiss]